MSESSEQHEPDLDSEGTNDGNASERYLTFELSDQTYGIELSRVQEIIRVQRATPVPSVASHIRGVINLRGTVVPVIDVRERMGIDLLEPGERTCVVVCSFCDEGVGLIVDAVCGVVEVVESEVIGGDQNPIDSSAADDIIRGLVRMDDGVKILISLDQMLMREDDRQTQALASA